MTEKIQNLFAFIDYLYTETQYFESKKPLIDRVDDLLTQRNSLKPRQNFKDKIMFDELKPQIESEFSMLENEVINIIKSKIKELDVADISTPIININAQTDLSKLQLNFDENDLESIQTAKTNYIEFRKVNNHSFYMDFFFSGLDSCLHEFFEYFKESDLDNLDVIKFKKNVFKDFAEAVNYLVTGEVLTKEKEERKSNINDLFDDRDIVMIEESIIKSDLSINEIFNTVRYNDLGKSDIYKILKKYTEDFDNEITKSVVSDLEFYLFIEKQEFESTLTNEDIDRAIQELNDKGRDIPYIEFNLNRVINDKNESVIDLTQEIRNEKYLNLEELLYPFEFFSLYQLKNFLKLKLDSSKDDNSIIAVPKLKTHLKIEDNNIKKLANNFFEGEIENLELLKYLSENFSSTHPRFNDLTKFNHIYRYFNENKREDNYNLEHGSYKVLIKELFNFDYGKREIKGRTEKHIKQLKNIASNYRDLKK